jgi:plastocyanin domain-containing protein
MLKITHLIGTLVGFGIVLGTSQVIAASGMNGDMPHASTQKFQPVGQPLAIKLGVSAVGVGLIGLELWWFLLSKPRSP